MKFNWIDWTLIIAIVLLAGAYGWFMLYPKVHYNPEAVYIEPLPYDTTNSTYSIYTSEKPVMPELTSTPAEKGHAVDWLGPAAVEWGNYVAGDVIEHYLDVGNAGDTTKAIKVYAKKPDNYRSKENQYMPLAWIKILADNGKVMVKPKSVTRVPVIIAVPPGSNVQGKHFETWFVSQDFGIFEGTTPGGMIGSFNGSRWILHFK